MKTTDWFPGSVKPVRAGLYERLVCGEACWAVFDGAVWYLSSPTQQEALEFAADKKDGVSDQQTRFQWRGILQ